MVGTKHLFFPSTSRWYSEAVSREVSSPVPVSLRCEAGEEDGDDLLHVSQH